MDFPEQSRAKKCLGTDGNILIRVLSKTAAPAAISTKCGFTNGAGWTVAVSPVWRG